MWCAIKSKSSPPPEWSLGLLHPISHISKLSPTLLDHLAYTLPYDAPSQLLTDISSSQHFFEPTSPVIRDWTGAARLTS